MLRIIGLESFRNDYPGQLSGGMAQRVSLVRSLINEPDILLLDEPLGALDAFTRMNMQDEILKVWQEKKQLAIMVTHDVDEAIYMGTRVIVMDAHPGRVVSDIKIDQAYPRSAHRRPLWPAGMKSSTACTSAEKQRSAVKRTGPCKEKNADPMVCVHK